jgi:hypothetical protein
MAAASGDVVVLEQLVAELDAVISVRQKGPRAAFELLQDHLAAGNRRGVWSAAYGVWVSLPYGFPADLALCPPAPLSEVEKAAVSARLATVPTVGCCDRVVPDGASFCPWCGARQPV